MSDLIIGLEELAHVEVRVSSDAAKRDPELVCGRCETRLCDVEHGDALDVLASEAIGHACPDGPECINCGHEYEDGDVTRCPGRCGYCTDCCHCDQRRAAIAAAH